LDQLCALLHTTKEIISFVPSYLVTGEWAWLQGNHGSISCKIRILLFSTTFRPAVGPIQPLVWWVPLYFSLGAQKIECEADHILPSCAEVRIHGAILPLTHSSSRHSA